MQNMQNVYVNYNIEGLPLSKSCRVTVKFDSPLSFFTIKKKSFPSSDSSSSDIRNLAL